MKQELVVNEIFWNNTGAGAIGTLASGSTHYFVPTSGGSGTVTTTSATNQWKKIYLGGNVDELYLTYRGKITVIGGLANVTVHSLFPLVCGQTYDSPDADFNTPAAVNYTPANFGGGVTSPNQGDSLAVACWTSGLEQQSSSNLVNPAFDGAALFRVASPNAVNDTISWTCQIGKKANAMKTGGGTIPGSLGELRTTGLRAIWIAIAFSFTATGTLVTTQLKGEIRVIGYNLLQPVTTTGHGGVVTASIPATV